MLIMKKLFLILSLLLACLTLPAQTMRDSNYRTIGYVKSDGTIQNANYSTIGHIKTDGTEILKQMKIYILKTDVLNLYKLIFTISNTHFFYERLLAS